MDEISIKGAELLKPIFDAQKGKNGRLSVQTDPRCYRDADAIVRQAVHLSKLAPNIIVKIPVTAAGVTAIEEATYRGISINATVCFSLPQCIAVAEAVERGLTRREQEGKTSDHGLVCTNMVPAGRLAESRRRQTDIAGPRVFVGRAGGVQRPTAVPGAAVSPAFRCGGLRNHMHWSEYHGDVVISPPHAWQKRFNACTSA